MTALRIAAGTRVFRIYHIVEVLRSGLRGSQFIVRRWGVEAAYEQAMSEASYGTGAYAP